MFRFANPSFLYLLGLVAVFALLHYVAFYRRRRRIARYGDPALVNQLFVDVSLWRPEVKMWLGRLLYVRTGPGPSPERRQAGRA